MTDRGLYCCLLPGDKFGCWLEGGVHEWRLCDNGLGEWSCSIFCGVMYDWLSKKVDSLKHNGIL